MQTVLKYFRRAARSRGFGVHSPFAYTFITEVLHPSPCYAYYAYDVVGSDARMRLLVRLLAYFDPATIAIDVADSAPKVRAAVQAACRRARIVEEDADFIVTDSSTPYRTDVNMLILGKNARAVLADLRARMTTGMSFALGKDCAVVVPASHLPRQDFDIKL